MKTEQCELKQSGWLQMVELTGTSLKHAGGEGGRDMYVRGRKKEKDGFSIVRFSEHLHPSVRLFFILTVISLVLYLCKIFKIQKINENCQTHFLGCRNKICITLWL